MGNDAFISYSHGADGELAPALERGMERLARPWYRVRALSVFRDQSDLALTPHLWETIRETLDGSRYLVVLLSPESSTSKWVNQELTHWCSTRGTDQLLLVLTGGELAWDEAIGDFSLASTAVPSALRGQYRGEPLYEDLRWARTASDVTLRNPAFRGAVARLASPIHGMPPDDLEGEDVRLRRRARRLARAGVVALGVLTATATVASVVAVQQADHARDRAAEAEARSGALAALDLPISRLDEAFVASLRAAGRDVDNPDRFRSAQTLVGRYPRLSQLLPVEAEASPAVVSELAVSADGQIGVDVLTIVDGGPVHILVRPQLAAAAPVDLGASIFVSYVADTTALVTVDDAGGASLITEDGSRPVDGEVWALDSGGDRAVVARGDRQLLVRLSTGEQIADLGPVNGGIWPLFTSQVVVAWSPGQLSLFDPADGALLATGPTTVDPAALFTTTSGSAVATIEGPTDAPVLRRWERDGDVLIPSPTTVAVPVPSFSVGVLSPSGDRFSAFGDSNHAVIDTVSGTVVARPRGTPVRFDNSGRYVATGGNRLTVWDVESGETIFAAPEPVKAMTWSAGCDSGAVCRLATVGSGLALWEPVSRVRTVLADEINAEAVALSRDGSIVASGGWGRTVAVWSARLLPDDRDPAVLAESGPDGRAVFDPSSGVIARLDGGTLEVERGSETSRAEVAGATDLRVVPGGNAVMVRRNNGWDLVDSESGTVRPLDERCRADLSAVAPTGSMVAALDAASGLLAVCTVADGALVANANVSGGVADPSAIAIEESGSVVVGGSSSFAVYGLLGDQLTTGTAVLTAFGGDASPVSSAAFSNGRVAVGLLGGDGALTGGPARGRVVVWDLLAGTEPIAYDVDERDVVKVALVDGGRTLVTAARDAADGALTVQVWEATNRRRLGRSLTGLEGDVLTLTGDAATIVASDTTGRVLRWELSADPQADICDILGAPFSDRRLEQLALEPVTDPCR
ncbi:MAG: TIR domain-containing protein [Acidimicrobiia bacterium]